MTTPLDQHADDAVPINKCDDPEPDEISIPSLVDGHPRMLALPVFLTVFAVGYPAALMAERQRFWWPALVLGLVLAPNAVLQWMTR